MPLGYVWGWEPSPGRRRGAWWDTAPEAGSPDTWVLSLLCMAPASHHVEPGAQSLPALRGWGGSCATPIPSARGCRGWSLLLCCPRAAASPRRPTSSQVPNRGSPEPGGAVTSPPAAQSLGGGCAPAACGLAAGHLGSPPAGPGSQSSVDTWLPPAKGQGARPGGLQRRSPGAGTSGSLPCLKGLWGPEHCTAGRDVSRTRGSPRPGTGVGAGGGRRAGSAGILGSLQPRHRRAGSEPTGRNRVASLLPQ